MQPVRELSLGLAWGSDAGLAMEDFVPLLRRIL